MRQPVHVRLAAKPRVVNVMRAHDIDGDRRPHEPREGDAVDDAPHAPRVARARVALRDQRRLVRSLLGQVRLEVARRVGTGSRRELGARALARAVHHHEPLVVDGDVEGQALHQALEEPQAVLLRRRQDAAERSGGAVVGEHRQQAGEPRARVDEDVAVRRARLHRGARAVAVAHHVARQDVHRALDAPVVVGVAHRRGLELGDLCRHPVHAR
mmetsp:Transcript_5623/g.20131  ORF Transcript_5623/g.20131 Transcript_5623/m.20131 type:complete len:213 (+) Transcript_5623:2994-3632(+)